MSSFTYSKNMIRAEKLPAHYLDHAHLGVACHPGLTLAMVYLCTKFEDFSFDHTMI